MREAQRARGSRLIAASHIEPRRRFQRPRRRQGKARSEGARSTAMD
jgi:hypothetical protein